MGDYRFFRRAFVKKRRVAAAVAGTVLLYLALTRGLYFFPATLALGPCLPDWTSPSTYLAVVNEQASPMISRSFDVGGVQGKICYGSPSARGRLIFGEPPGTQSNGGAESPRPVVPYGRLWRMGANEPTRLFINQRVALGNLALPAGRYSLYAMPNQDEWTIFVSRSTFHWGNQISDRVRNQEVGSITVAVEPAETYAERMTVRFELLAPGAGNLVIEWADVAVQIPIQTLEQQVSDQDEN